MKLRIGARVALKAVPDVIGVVIAQRGEKLKIMWSDYTSSWNTTAALVAIGGQRPRQVSADERR